MDHIRKKKTKRTASAVFPEALKLFMAHFVHHLAGPWENRENTGKVQEMGRKYGDI